MKKHVLILVNHDVVIYNFRRELVERLLADGFDVTVSSPYGPRIDQLIGMGCHYETIQIERHSTNVTGELKLMMAYRRLFKKISPDIVLTYTIKPNVYGGLMARWHKIPYLANITGLGTAVEKPGLLQIITVGLYRSALKRCRCVFFQNEHNRRFFREKKIVRWNDRLIPGSGVNTKQFDTLPFPEGEKVGFAFISRIMKEKGIDQYLEMAEVIKKRYPQTEFHVCGFCEEAYEDRLEAVNAEGVIKYHGMVSDVRTVLKDIQCTVHPSYYPEGISNVLLESAASGRALITTDRSGCRETVLDGVSGYLVQPEDVQGLIGAVDRFMKFDRDERQAMGKAGRKYVAENFDRQLVVDAYMEEINRIISSGRSKPIRVLHVLGRMDAGGSESRTMDIYRTIDRSKVQFDFAIHTKDHCYFTDEVKALGGRIYALDRFTGKNLLKFSRSWHAFLKQHPEYHIIHGHQTTTAFAYLRQAKKCGVPVRMAHSRNANKESTVKNFTSRFAGSSATDCFAVSKLAAISEFGTKATEQGKVRIIPNAIDASKYIYQETIREEIRKSLGVNGGIVYGHVGRFHQQKNHKFLIDIFAQLHKKDPKAKLVLIGEGPLKEEIEVYVSKKGLTESVMFLGVRRDVNRLLSALDRMIFPSLYEGLPGVILEAQAAGLPCVISDTITDEVHLTDLVTVQPLTDTAEQWMETVEALDTPENRSLYPQRIKEAGYDIHEVAAWYENFYINTLKERTDEQ